ncbi:hypothetical protein H9I32_09700 [Bacillus sp. Xin]|uniref:hypothetical protein n=1 Tax=unclassified Bacillus (in: firmicutes) TaxID=185979 RepID=UPI001574B933|nr:MULTISPECIES: hypothetical protein [unclassified Bacillus (in: firmicutes)]MBC6972657.1 hypothetical protein [Bacillus sp. Xin]NSW39125.1 hypothetical protein [Bacillus sp. Xin1]
MSDIQKQLKLTEMKPELLKELAEVEAQESAPRQVGMFRTVDLATNVEPFACVVTCFPSRSCVCTIRFTRKEQLANPIATSPALLARMKDELKNVVAEVEAQDSALRKDNKVNDKT